MDHRTALSQTKTPTQCSTKLIFLHREVLDDIRWLVYYCPSDDEVVYCVESGVHWWNYTSANPKPEDLAEGRRLAANSEG